VAVLQNTYGFSRNVQSCSETPGIIEQTLLMWLQKPNLRLESCSAGYGSIWLP
jgi:hypothetical protein